MVATSATAFLLLVSLCRALDEVDYLKQFGYLPSSGAESQLTSDAVSDALKRFQRMFGLPQTGEMDEATSNLMSKKRCGVKDVQRTLRVKRSLPHPRWKSNKFTFLGCSLFDVFASHRLIVAISLCRKQRNMTTAAQFLEISISK
ncbi:unnamed protein product [Cylicocyclus nassatus]|uniref:Peptidoglycan binding-like domain-containing protein n=1 Tax=Cylicocyclus nassatus TaxID=53992 RepID=A0AA36GW67_CYLNA|nr:unnamed protein product [Cylicocyclus nassatus]